MKKTLTLIFLVIVTIGLTYALVNYIKMDGFAFAWALNFLLMLCVSMFIEALKSQLNSSYFDEKAWEQKGKIYELFGVNIFRKLLVIIGWEKLNKKANPVKNNAQDLMNLHHQTKKSELGHLIVLIIVAGFNVYVALKFGIIKSLSLFSLNVILNLYPVILQRYNRPRIERAIRLNKRS